MTESLNRRHGLEAFLTEADGAQTAGVGLRARIRDDLGHVNLRADSTNQALVDAIVGIAGQPLPLVPNTISEGDHRIFWLGPDEWLVLTDADATSPLTESIREASRGMHVWANDISGGQVAIELRGDAARNLLAKGCTLDLHPSVFPVGACAQSGLAKANVLIGLVEDTPTFIIVVRRSFADYLCRWLGHAGSDTGIAFSAD